MDEKEANLINNLNKISDGLFEEYYSVCAKIRRASRQLISSKIKELGKKVKKGKEYIYTYTIIECVTLPMSCVLINSIVLYESDNDVRIYYRCNSQYYELSDLDLMDIKVIIDYFYPNETK